MKAIYIYITILLFSIPMLGQSQIYIQGKNVLPFSQIAKSTYLQQSKRISLDEARDARRKIQGSRFHENLIKLNGEYFMYDGFLISAVCSELAVIQKEKYPGIYFNYLYLKNDYNPKDEYLSYEDFGTYKTMISYNRSSNYLSYYVENSTYSIIGAIYSSDDKVSEAQKFIEKLVESISFKK